MPDHPGERVVGEGLGGDVGFPARGDGRRRLVAFLVFRRAEVVTGWKPAGTVGGKDHPVAFRGEVFLDIGGDAAQAFRAGGSHRLLEDLERIGDQGTVPVEVQPFEV